MGISDDYIRSKRSPGRTEHPTSLRKSLVVDLLSGKKVQRDVQFRPAHSGESQCAGCEHLQYPGQSTSPCRIVAGRVTEQDTCDLHKERDQGTLGIDTQEVQSQGENND